MGGDYLFDQGAAGTWHTEYENRDGRGISISPETIEQAGIEHRENPLEKLDDAQLVIVDLAVFEGIPFAQVFKSSCEIFNVFEGFSQREMDERCLVHGQIVSATQGFKRGQIGIAVMERLEFRPIEVSLCVIGTDRDRPFILSLCVSKAALILENAAQVAASRVVMGIDRERSLIVRHRGIDFALLRKCQAEIVVDIGIARLKGESAARMGYGVIDSVPRDERNTQIAVGTGVVRLKGNDPLILGRGVVDPSGLVIPHGIIKDSLNVPKHIRMLASFALLVVQVLSRALAGACSR